LQDFFECLVPFERSGATDVIGYVRIALKAIDSVDFNHTRKSNPPPKIGIGYSVKSQIFWIREFGNYSFIFGP
jgi:hypothetical protein